GHLALHVRLLEPVRSAAVVIDTAHCLRRHGAGGGLTGGRRRHRLHRAHRDRSADGNRGGPSGSARRIAVVAAGPMRVLVGVLAVCLHVAAILLTVLLQVGLLLLAVLLQLFLLLLAALRLRAAVLLALRLVLARRLLPRALAAAPLRLCGLSGGAAGALAPTLRGPAAGEGATGRRARPRDSTASSASPAYGAGRSRRDETRERQRSDTPSEALFPGLHLAFSFLLAAGRGAK